MTEVVLLEPSDLRGLMALEQAQEVAVSTPASLNAALASSALANRPGEMRHQVFGARSEEGRLLGYAMLALQPFDAELEAILVASEARRQGIAGYLLDRVVTAARDQQLERLLLEVRAGNQAAIALYRAAGFQLDGVRKGYYPPDPAAGAYPPGPAAGAYPPDPAASSPTGSSGLREDAWLMSLDLNS